MKNLAISHRRKEQRLETIIANELTQIKIKFQDEEEKMIRRQEVCTSKRFVYQKDFLLNTNFKSTVVHYTFE